MGCLSREPATPGCCVDMFFSVFFTIFRVWPPSVTPCIRELKDRIDVFLTHVSCRKTAAIMLVIYQKYGGLWTITGSLLTDDSERMYRIPQPGTARSGLMCRCDLPGQ